LGGYCTCASCTPPSVDDIRTCDTARCSAPAPVGGGIVGQARPRIECSSDAPCTPPCSPEQRACRGTCPHRDRGHHPQATERGRGRPLKQDYCASRRPWSASEPPPLARNSSIASASSALATRSCASGRAAVAMRFGGALTTPSAAPASLKAELGAVPPHRVNDHRELARHCRASALMPAFLGDLQPPGLQAAMPSAGT
jgi:hypothetical protein